jgi:hypothetical protein
MKSPLSQSPLSVRIVLLFALGLLGACTSATEKLILEEPPSTHLGERGESHQLEVVATDKEGRTISRPKLRWWSSAPDVVAVSEFGQVTARKTGEADVIVQSGKAEARIHFRVTIASALEVKAGGLDHLEVGKASTLHVTVKSEDGTPMPEVVPEWSSTDEDIALVQDGKVHGVSPGRAVITCKVANLKRRMEVIVVRSDFARLAITPIRNVLDRPGLEVKLKAQAQDSLGRSIPTPPVSWFSSDPRVARVASDGTVTALTPGKVLISAMSGKRRASADVIVNNPAAPKPPPRPLPVAKPIPPAPTGGSGTGGAGSP